MSEEDFGPLDSAAAAASSAAAEAAADDGTVARTAFGDVLCVHPSGVDPDMGEHDGVWCGVCFEVALYGEAVFGRVRIAAPTMTYWA